MGQLLKINAENEEPNKLQNCLLNNFVYKKLFCQTKQFSRKLVSLLEGLK